MKFTEITTLRQCGAVEQLQDENLNRIVMVGEEVIADWEDNHSRYGYDHCSIYPAVDRGERAFLLKKNWWPAANYRAKGDQETIISLKEGAELLLKHGAFKHLWPSSFRGSGQGD